MFVETQYLCLLILTITFIDRSTSQQPAPLSTDVPIGADEFDQYLGDVGIPVVYNDKVTAPGEALLHPGATGSGGAPRPTLTPPSRWDWRQKGVISDVRRQRRCAACFAFANIGVLEAVIRIKFNDTRYRDLSEQQLITCDRRQSGCRGGSMTSFDFWKTQGPNNEGCNPYQATSRGSTTCSRCGQASYRVKDWETAYMSDVRFVKQLIMTRGPGYLSFKTYYPFYNYWRGYGGEVYKHPKKPGRIRGGHAVQLIGWDDSKQAWLLQNGWGMRPPGPLKDGSFYFPYDLYKRLHFGVAFIQLRKVGGARDRGSKLYDRYK